MYCLFKKSVPYLEYLIKNSKKSDDAFRFDVLIHSTKLSIGQAQKEWHTHFSKESFLIFDHQEKYWEWSWKAISDICFSQNISFSEKMELDPVRTIQFLDLIRNLSTHVPYFFGDQISDLDDRENLSLKDIEIAKQKDQPYALIFAQNAYLDEAWLARKANIKEDQPGELVRSWVEQGLIFSVPYQSRQYVPSFALDEYSHPRDGLKEILTMLRPQKNSLEIAYWFFGVNSFLGGARPMDVLKHDVARVLAASQNEANIVTYKEDK